MSINDLVLKVNDVLTGSVLISTCRYWLAVHI